MNERSSRSHTVLGLTVESRCSRQGEEDDDGKVRIATLVSGKGGRFFLTSKSYVRICNGTMWPFTVK